MSLNSIKTVILGASLITGIVACSGKNKNNLKIDGTYEVEKMSFTDVQTKKVSDLGEENQLPEVVEIKDNVMSMYTFSNDKKAVQITSAKLNIKGKKIIDVTADDKADCSEGTDGSEVLAGTVSKRNGQLVILTDETNGRTEIVLKEIPAEKFTEITKDLRAGKLEKACIANGEIQKKLGKISSTGAIVQSMDQSLSETQAKSDDSKKDLLQAKDLQVKDDLSLEVKQK